MHRLARLQVHSWHWHWPGQVSIPEYWAHSYLATVS
uniref:Uncharacterized protein n=1 Tax=Anguilla anguilla TaxID=7936 RepID=A0A0E9PB18_ANGAN